MLSIINAFHRYRIGLRIGTVIRKIESIPSVYCFPCGFILTPSLKATKSYATVPFTIRFIPSFIKAAPKFSRNPNRISDSLR